MSYLDTRDLYTEREELTARADDPDQIDPLDEDETERLAAINALFDEIGEEAGLDGGTMIPEYLFTDYAEDFAADIGAIGRDATWPICHIDWEAAADELKQDYTEVDFDGTTYYVRLD